MVLVLVHSKTYEKDLIKDGFKIIIYANHLIKHLANDGKCSLDYLNE